VSSSALSTVPSGQVEGAGCVERDGDAVTEDLTVECGVDALAERQCELDAVQNRGERVARRARGQG